MISYQVGERLTLLLASFPRTTLTAAGLPDWLAGSALAIATPGRLACCSVAYDTIPAGDGAMYGRDPKPLGGEEQTGKQWP